MYLDLGAFGEQAAASYLEKQGYHVLERNFSCRVGEIDIIASLGEIIVFVEVKTRKNLNYGLPCESVTSSKKEHIKKAVRYYALRNNLFQNDFRLDVIEIYIKGEKAYIHHMEDAFR